MIFYQRWYPMYSMNVLYQGGGDSYKHEAMVCSKLGRILNIHKGIKVFSWKENVSFEFIVLFFYLPKLLVGLSLSTPATKILELERDSFLVRLEMVRSLEDTWRPVRNLLLFQCFWLKHHCIVESTLWTHLQIILTFHVSWRYLQKKSLDKLPLWF